MHNFKDLDKSFLTEWFSNIKESGSSKQYVCFVSYSYHFDIILFLFQKEVLAFISYLSAYSLSQDDVDLPAQQVHEAILTQCKRIIPVSLFCCCIFHKIHKIIFIIFSEIRHFPKIQNAYLSFKLFLTQSLNNLLMLPVSYKDMVKVVFLLNLRRLFKPVQNQLSLLWPMKLLVTMPYRYEL